MLSMEGSSLSPSIHEGITSPETWDAETPRYLLDRPAGVLAHFHPPPTSCLNPERVY